MKKVEQIKQLPILEKRKKVAAYARVSCGKDAMLQSLASQVSYYNNFIQNHDGWEFAGIYSDEAKTGTKEDRVGFQNLLQACRDGKVDLVITKSISRFARNTITVLESIRELKDLGIAVYFEEENLYSTSGECEMILNIMSSYYQEESRSVSENMKWRIKKNFQEGIMWGSNDYYGYRVVKSKLVVVPEEAKVVKHSFDLYESGYGDIMISKILNKEGIKPLISSKWSYNSIKEIIKNEVYTGDLLLQKTYRENYITKKTKINKGELTKYLVEDDHEAIISKEQFNRCNTIRKERALKVVPLNEKKNYPFTSLIICGNCGKRYRHKVCAYQDSWICNTFDRLGKDYCNSTAIPERALYKTCCEVLHIEKFDEALFKKKIKNIKVLKDRYLVFTFKNGDEVTTRWEYPSRSEGWTQEMRELARQRSIAQHLAKKGESHE